MMPGSGLTPFWLFMAVLLCFVPAATLNAQTASFRSVDTNSDNVLSLEELVAAFGPAGATRLLEDADRNGDNRLTISELRTMRGGGQGDDDHRDGRGSERENRDSDDRDDGDGSDEGGDEGDDD